MALCHWMNTSQHCAGTMILWYIRNCLCDDTASHSRRLACSTILPKTFHFFIHPFVRCSQHLLLFTLHWSRNLRIWLSGLVLRLSAHFLQFFYYYVDYCYSKFIISCGSLSGVDEDSYHQECGTVLIGKCYHCCTGACCLHFQCVCSSRRYR